MRALDPLIWLVRGVVDFALPPRCPGCGVIIPQVGLFCPSCWGELGLAGTGSGCSCCGCSLEATEAETCGRCMADPKPLLDRVRHAVEYGPIARSLVLKLKYGRKTALAGTVAGYMARPLTALTPGALLVPVPLHRRRLWNRGFNQAALIARALGRRAGHPVDVELLRRTVHTPRLKGMNPVQRREAVKNAFALRAGKDVRGRTIILVDDVITTGSTAEACAKLLKRHGAASVELIAWARVSR
jgi:ComF family protein